MQALRLAWPRGQDLTKFDMWKSMSPSDLCTNNVPAISLEKYTEQSHIYFASGRAAVAQKLHPLKDHSSVRSHLVIGDLLAKKVGW